VFQRLTKSADPKDVKEWTRQAEQAEKDRLHNVEAMDIYNAKTHTRECSFQKIICKCIDHLSVPGLAIAPGRATVQAELIEDEQKSGQSKGMTSWLATGLKIEEAQYVMQIHLLHRPADMIGKSNPGKRGPTTIATCNPDANAGDCEETGKTAVKNRQLSLQGFIILCGPRM